MSVRARSCSSPIETCDGSAANHGAVQFQTACDSDKGSNHAGTLSLSFPPASQTHSPGGGYSMLGGAASGSPGRHRLRGPQTAAEGQGGHGTGQAWGTGGTRMIWYYSRLHAHAAGRERGTVPAGHLDRSKGNPKGTAESGKPGGGKTAIARRKEEDRKQIRRPAR